MNRIDLQRVEHNIKKGQQCPQHTPNVSSDCTLYEDGELVGFFIKELPSKAKALADIANHELRSDRVPKAVMERKERIGTRPDGTGIYDVVQQYSTIIGSIPPKPHMRRVYASRSSVHAVPTTKTFVKAMMALMNQCELIYRDIMPETAQEQERLVREIPEKWRFGKLFTSSISNYNISAPYHTDNANIKGSCNFIITKRNNSKGGNLHVPDYDATFDQCDYSLLVYPAWRNMHGVTPITTTQDGGYRNSLVFYALQSLKNA